jgi:hypothetical protein
MVEARLGDWKVFGPYLCLSRGIRRHPHAATGLYDLVKLEAAMHL